MQWVQEHPEQSVSTDDEDTSNTGTTTDEEEAAAQGQQQQQVNMAGAAGIDYDRLAAALAGSKAQLVYTGDKYEGTEDEDVEDHFNEVDDWLIGMKIFHPHGTRDIDDRSKANGGEAVGILMQSLSNTLSRKIKKHDGAAAAEQLNVADWAMPDIAAAVMSRYRDATLTQLKNAIRREVTTADSVDAIVSDAAFLKQKDGEAAKAFARRVDTHCDKAGGEFTLRARIKLVKAGLHNTKPPKADKVAMKGMYFRSLRERAEDLDNDYIDFDAFQRALVKEEMKAKNQSSKTFGSEKYWGKETRDSRDKDSEVFRIEQEEDEEKEMQMSMLEEIKAERLKIEEARKAMEVMIVDAKKAAEPPAAAAAAANPAAQGILQAPGTILQAPAPAQQDQKPSWEQAPLMQQQNTYQAQGGYGGYGGKGGGYGRGYGGKGWQQGYGGNQQGGGQLPGNPAYTGCGQCGAVRPVHELVGVAGSFDHGTGRGRSCGRLRPPVLTPGERAVVRETRS